MAASILLVDDDAHILETAEDILEALDYEVRTAESGAQALQSLKEGPCHLLIVDLNLLDTTGVELAVQAKQIHPNMAIILMTGEANVDLGPAKTLIASVLTKPVNPPDLLALIHQLI